LLKFLRRPLGPVAWNPTERDQPHSGSDYPLKAYGRALQITEDRMLPTEQTYSDGEMLKTGCSNIRLDKLLITIPH
jgi:hypothetical protein